MKLDALAAVLLASAAFFPPPLATTAFACGGYGALRVEDPRVVGEAILAASEYRDPQIVRVVEAGRSAEIDFIHQVGRWAIPGELHLRLTDAGTWVEDVPTPAAK